MIKTAFELKTVGKLLAEKRVAKKLSYDQISEIIKINPEYLEALEKTDYSKFPSEVYIKGFLRNYAKFLEIDPEHALALYRREQEKSHAKPKLKVGEKIKAKKIDLSLTPGRIVASIAIFIAVLTIIYIGSYVADIFQSPELALTKPLAVGRNQVGTYTSFTEKLQLEGTSEIGSKLMINGQEYRVNSFEQFNVEITLQQGPNEIKIVSENQFGRKSEIILNVTFEKELAVEPTTTISAENTNSITARIEVIGEGAYLEVKTDGELKTATAYPVNEVVEFSANESFELYIPRTESINLFINGLIQEVDSPRMKFVLLDGKVSKVNQ